MLAPIAITNGNISDLLRMGFTVYPPVDAWHMPVTLPSGWTALTTPDPYFTHILDDLDRRRASIYHRVVSFLPRKTYWTLDTAIDCRIRPIMGYRFGWEALPWVGEVVYGGYVLNTLQVDTAGLNYPHECIAAVEAQLSPWLERYYPDYRNIHAYW